MITFYITSDSSSGRKELFVMRAENGRAYYEAEHARYRDLYPNVDAPQQSL